MTNGGGPGWLKNGHAYGDDAETHRDRVLDGWIRRTFGVSEEAT